MHGLNTLAFLNDRFAAAVTLGANDPSRARQRQATEALGPFCATPARRPDIAIVPRGGETWYLPRNERGHLLARALLADARRDGSFYILTGEEAVAATEAIYLDSDSVALGL